MRLAHPQQFRLALEPLSSESVTVKGKAKNAVSQSITKIVLLELRIALPEAQVRNRIGCSELQTCILVQQKRYQGLWTVRNEI